MGVVRKEEGGGSKRRGASVSDHVGDGTWTITEETRYHYNTTCYNHLMKKVNVTQRNDGNAVYKWTQITVIMYTSKT